MANALTLKIMSNIVEKCGGTPSRASGSSRPNQPAVQPRGSHYLSEAIAKTGKRVETEHESAIRSLIRGESSSRSTQASSVSERVEPTVRQVSGSSKGGVVRLEDLIKSKSLNR